MDLVNQFNSELSSLYDSKPPISKGKMTSVTKAALKAVKLYKHVVQSVEKFIQKCKPEYKIPGLYVIDSIIRQSRHQFGTDKDIFAGRFQRNLQTTFAHLFRCSDEDKPKVIRVLNLWQKNKIYAPEVIQPLIDMADPNNPIWETIRKQEAAASNSKNNIGGDQAPLPPLMSDQVQFKKELLDYDYEEDDGDGDRGKNQFQQPHAPPPPTISIGGHNQNEFGPNSFSGFDALGSILTNPEVLRQLQTLQEQMAAAAAQQQLSLTPEQERQRKMAELNKQEAAFDQRLAQTVSRLPFAVDFGEDGQGGSPRKENSGYLQQLGTDQNSNQLSNHQGPMLLPPPFFQQLTQEQKMQATEGGITIPASQNPFGIPLTFPVPPPYQQVQQNDSNGMYNTQEQSNHFGQFQPPQTIFEPPNENNYEEERSRERGDRHERRRRRSRSNNRHRPGSRSPSSKFRRRSRSNSRNRSGRKRYRSRSRDRDRKEEREKERERQRKGFPAPRKEHLSVCSTTLWVGHLSRQVAEEELSDTFGAYGDVVSIDLISSRGCAFVVMNRRQDACKALDRLKNTKLQSKTITLAWAPGKGVKGRDWKDYWEVEAGVSFIPWNKLSMETDLEEFEEGGCMDEDTLPSHLKNKPKVPKGKSEAQSTPIKDEGDAKSVTDGTPTKLAFDQTTGGEVEARQDMTALGTPATVVPPGMVNSPFGLPPTPVGLMPSMVNMMMPPSMLGGPMGVVAPQFSPMGFPMMGQMGMMPPGGMPPGMPQPELPQMKPGLLGEMPMQHMQMGNPTLGGGNTGADEEMTMEENRKRHTEKRESRDRKRSRFDDANDRNSPSGMPKEESPARNFNDFDHQVEGYGGFSGSADALLGGPLSQGPGLRPPMDRMQGFPSPHLPRASAAFSGPRKPWLENRDGSGGQPWMDNASQNPFINPGQNPFAGSPFVQQNSENPFELAAAGPQGSGPIEGPGPFFGPGGEHFSNRGGWRGAERGWRGDRGGMRGRGGMGGGRGGGGGWQDRIEEDWGNDREQRGFRGGGRGGRRGGDFGRGRRRDWGEGGRDRDQDWDEGGGGGRERGRDRNRGGRERERKASFDKENTTFMQPNANIEENWEEECNRNDNTDAPVNNYENRRNSYEPPARNSGANPMDEVWDDEPNHGINTGPNDFNGQHQEQPNENWRAHEDNNQVETHSNQMEQNTNDYPMENTPEYQGHKPSENYERHEQDQDGGNENENDGNENSDAIIHRSNNIRDEEAEQAAWHDRHEANNRYEDDHEHRPSGNWEANNDHNNSSKETMIHNSDHDIDMHHNSAANEVEYHHQRAPCNEMPVEYQDQDHPNEYKNEPEPELTRDEPFSDPCNESMNETESAKVIRSNSPPQPSTSSYSPPVPAAETTNSENILIDNTIL